MGSLKRNQNLTLPQFNKIIFRVFIQFCYVLCCGVWPGNFIYASVPSEISGIDLISNQARQFQLQQPKFGTVIVFLSSLCPCSNSHIAALNLLFQDFSPNGFKFVGIHSNANESLVQSIDYFKKSGVNFPVIQDIDAKIADQFEAFKTPHVFVVDSKMKILFQGGVDDSRSSDRPRQHYLRNALAAVLNGQEPTEKNVRVLGCVIKRP